MINICTSTYQRRRIFLRTSQLLLSYHCQWQLFMNKELSTLYYLPYTQSIIAFAKRKDSFTLKLNFTKKK